MFTIRTILHPTDFSQTSQTVFKLACDLARSLGADVVVAHVLPRPVTVPEAAWMTIDLKSYWADLKAQLTHLFPEEPGVRVSHRLLEGDQATEILRLAQGIPCDLIIMGTHGRTGLSRLALGSVAEQVVRKAPCPVMTVK